MKSYTSPKLTDYGDIAEVTAIAGAVSAGDILVNSSGTVLNTGNQSIDACTTGDFVRCNR